MNKPVFWFAGGIILIYFLLKKAYKPESQIDVHFGEEKLHQTLAANAVTAQAVAQPVAGTFGTLPFVGAIYDMFAMANYQDAIKPNDLMLNMKVGAQFGNIPALNQKEYEAAVMQRYAGVFTGKIQ